jgi:hypothetical protein
MDDVTKQPEISVTLSPDAVSQLRKNASDLEAALLDSFMVTDDFNWLTNRECAKNLLKFARYILVVTWDRKQETVDEVDDF